MPGLGQRSSHRSGGSDSGLLRSATSLGRQNQPGLSPGPTLDRLTACPARPEPAQHGAVRLSRPDRGRGVWSWISRVTTCCDAARSPLLPGGEQAPSRLVPPPRRALTRTAERRDNPWEGRAVATAPADGSHPLEGGHIPRPPPATDDAMPGATRTTPDHASPSRKRPAAAGRYHRSRRPSLY